MKTKASSASAERGELLARFAVPRNQSNEERVRAVHREQIARGAIVSGVDPRKAWDDLEYLFSEQELDVLADVAKDVQREKIIREKRARLRRDLTHMVGVVERERDEQRRADLEAEARKRLGWPATGFPSE